LIARDVSALGAAPGGRRIATTSLVPLARPPRDGIAKRGRQSIRRAERSGCAVTATTDPRAFLQLHTDAAQGRPASYPRRLLQLLAERGELLFYDVTLQGEAVSSLAALTGGVHWMYWLAAQNERGREVEAGYVAVAALLDDAYAAGAAYVNLGASEGLPGVAAFKQRLGGLDVPVIQWVAAPAGTRLRDSTTRVWRQSAAVLRTEAVRLSRRLGLR